MEPKIVVNGKEYELPTSFTLGESADMEKITGQGYELEKGGALGLLAIAYVAVRRVDPSVTVDDIRSLTDTQIDVLRDKDAEPVPPTSADDTPVNSGPSSATSGSGSDDSPEPTPEPTGSPV
jgi:hypothetical protein